MSSERKNNDFTSIEDVLKEMLHDSKLEKGLDFVAIKEAWKDVMGNGVESYTEQVHFKNGLLTVKLTSSVLREELSYGKDKIINMLNDALNKKLIKKIRFL